MTRDYELGLVITPDASDEQARAIIDRITQTVSTLDGQVVRVDVWGRRRLAYPIEHHRDGLYFFLDLMLPPQGVDELERVIRVTEDILRHLLTARDPRIVADERRRAAEAAASRAAEQQQHAQAQEATAFAEAQAEASAEASLEASAEASLEASLEAPAEAQAEPPAPEPAAMAGEPAPATTEPSEAITATPEPAPEA